jgi:tRNA1Val (adenine37-N6)-methyltransferase
MANDYFSFKQFTIYQDACAMKVTTDACLFGAWVAQEMEKGEWEIENALDIGTGTGLLSLMVAQKFNLFIEAIEINHAAAQQASENIRESGFSGVNIIQGDVLKLPLKRYDCIFSNPPFYEAELASPNTDRSTAHHGEGLHWKDLFRFIAAHLKSGGIFFLLLPTKRLAEMQKLADDNGLHIHQRLLVKQTPGHTPFRVMVSGGKTPGNCLTTEMLVKDATGDYSLEFVELLKDYYLYL